MTTNSRRLTRTSSHTVSGLTSNLVKLEDLKIPNERVPEYTKEERQRMQKAFGYTYESLREVDPADGEERRRGYIRHGY